MLGHRGHHQLGPEQVVQAVGQLGLGQASHRRLPGLHVVPDDAGHPSPGADVPGAAAGVEGGRLLVWRTENDVSLTLRDGVLVETRGLGNDMISAEGGPALAAVRSRAAGQGSKRQVYSALDNKSVAMNFVCAVDDLGPETIVIVERRHATRHLRETCELQGGTVVNDYWVDSRGPTVWQSRQWGGPNIGYVQFRQLTP